MDLHHRIRKLIYVPQLSGGRKTFLHFYWDGKAWSLRDFSMPGVEPKPHYWPDPRLTVEDILALARAPGAFCCDAPEHPVKDVRFWHETTIEANRRYLGIEPDAAAASAATPAAAPPPARPAPRLVGGEPNTYQDRLRLGFWRYRDERFAGADDLFDPRYQPGGTQPPVFKTEHAHRNVLVRPDAGQDEIDAVWSAIPDGAHHKWFRSMTSSQALAQSVFANLKYHNKLGLLADLRGEDDLPPFPSGVVRPRYSWDAPQLELEYQRRLPGGATSDERGRDVRRRLSGGGRMQVERARGWLLLPAKPDDHPTRTSRAIIATAPILTSEAAATAVR